jgi:hypothetical protein
MGARDYSLVLNGSAQRLSRVLSNADDSQPSATENLPFRQLVFAADPANTAVVYVGTSSLVSSTVHGFSLDPTQATALDKIVLGPYESGPLHLSDFWVLGTTNERLHVLGIPY